MQVFNSSRRYGAVVQTLHWTTVALVLLAWLLGSFGDDLPRGTARDTGLFMHMTAGLVVFVLVPLRLLWRFADPPPPPEANAFGAWLDRIAQLAHVLLYVLLIAVPIAGIISQFARGQALPLFGLGSIASPWPADRTFARSVTGVHELLANALLALAGLHALAALAHHWLLRDRTLTRMLPGGSV